MESIVKKPRLEEDELMSDSILFDYTKWINDNGFKLSNKVVISRIGSCAQYGLVAIDDVTEGECLFIVPRTTLLTPLNCNVSEIFKNDTELCKQEHGWISLVLALMFECTNTQSFWSPYLKLLPPDLDLPMFWSRSELESMLKYTGVVEAVDKDIDNIESDFNKVALPFIRRHPESFSESIHDIHLYKKMVSYVMAYSFTEPDSGGGDQVEESDDSSSGDDQSKDQGGLMVISPPMMTPLADILNHISENNAFLEFGKDCLTMRAKKHINKGDEVYNIYGNLANWELLHMYGFTEHYTDNTFDTVDIPSSLIIDIASRMNNIHRLPDKLNYLNTCGILGDGTSFIFGKSEVMNGDTLSTLLKILNMNDDSLNNLKSDGWLSDENQDDDYDSISYESFSKLPQSWKKLVYKSAEDMLGKFPATLADKIQQLETLNKKCNTITEQRTFYSLNVTIGQMNILNKIMRFCK